MPSSDIYKVKDSPPVQEKPEPRASSRRRRRSSRENYDEAMNKDISNTHRRRSKNSGFRRFVHLMKKPEFSKKFWITTLSIAGLILLLLVVWDRYLRYSGSDSGPDRRGYELKPK